MAEITHIKTVKVTAEEIRQILARHFDMTAADVHFQIGSDPTDDGPGYGRQILNGAVITKDFLAPPQGPQKR